MHYSCICKGIHVPARSAEAFLAYILCPVHWDHHPERRRQLRGAGTIGFEAGERLSGTIILVVGGIGPHIGFAGGLESCAYSARSEY